MAGNLIVDEEYIRMESSNIRQNLQEMNNLLDQYLAILHAAKEHGIQNGKTAIAFKQYIACADMLKGNLSTMGDNLEELMKNYLLAIDYADQYLF